MKTDINMYFTKYCVKNNSLNAHCILLFYFWNLFVKCLGATKSRDVDSSWICTYIWATSNSQDSRLEPDQCVSIGWASLCTQKGQWFNSQSGHMTELQGWSLGGVHARGSQWLFLSHINVCLPLVLSKNK